jgi:hypothetical protein
MSLKTLLLGLLLSLVTLSCENVFIEDWQEEDPHRVFDEAWSFAHDYYSYFALKAVDWEASRQKYRPQVSTDMNDRQLFDLLADMFLELQDGHVNLVSDFGRSRYIGWYFGAPENFDYSVLERSYFKGEQEFIGPFEYFAFQDIGYVYLASFGREMTEGHLDALMQQLSSKKAVIIDVRNNGGGSGSQALKLAERFTTENKTVARRRAKDGSAANDFTEWQNIKLQATGNPSSGFLNKPIVVLTNRRCYSATNSFVQYMRELPEVTLIGDRTGGGAGTPKYTELPNGWILRVSATQTESPDGEEIESGIPPDIVRDASESSLAAGRDDLLDFALSYLN